MKSMLGIAATAVTIFLGLNAEGRCDLTGLAIDYTAATQIAQQYAQAAGWRPVNGASAPWFGSPINYQTSVGQTATVKFNPDGTLTWISTLPNSGKYGFFGGAWGDNALGEHCFVRVNILDSIPRPECHPYWAGMRAQVVGLAQTYDYTAAQQIALRYARAAGWRIETGPTAPPLVGSLSYTTNTGQTATVTYSSDGTLTRTTTLPNSRKHAHFGGAWGVNAAGEKCQIYVLVSTLEVVINQCNPEYYAGMKPSQAAQN
jgi:hypothetical protein